MSDSVDGSELARPQAPAVLLISGRPDTSPLVEAIAQAGFEYSTIASCSDAILSFEHEAPPVAVLDLSLSGMEGLEVLRFVKSDNVPTAIIAVSRVGSLRLAIEAMKLGAFDYLVEPFSSDQLLSVIRKAAMPTMSAEQKLALEVPHHPVFQSAIDASPIMKEINGAVQIADADNSAIFITGENEIGKAVCAHAIHMSSVRQNQPFVAVHCDAVPAEMIESELFGHLRGALPSAFTDRTGAVTEAEGGTLVVNDICALSLDVQAKLVRLIEQGSFQRIGSNKVEQADLRIVCTTARDPQIALEEGVLRQDLFNQLRKAAIYLPPLHESGKDIMQISQYVLQDISGRDKSLIKDKQDGDTETGEQRLSGDVRELQSALYNAITLNGDLVSETMHRDATPGEIAGLTKPTESEVVFVDASAKTVKAIKPLWLVEKEAITEALEICGQNVPKAAAYLEIGVSTIYRKKAEWEAEERSKAS